MFLCKDKNCSWCKDWVKLKLTRKECVLAKQVVAVRVINGKFSKALGKQRIHYFMKYIILLCNFKLNIRYLNCNSFHILTVLRLSKSSIIPCNQEIIILHLFKKQTFLNFHFIKISLTNLRSKDSQDPFRFFYLRVYMIDLNLNFLKNRWGSGFDKYHFSIHQNS